MPHANGSNHNCFVKSSGISAGPCTTTCLMLPVKGRGKARSRTGHEDPEGEVYSFTLSLTLALDMRKWSTPRPGRLTPGKVTHCIEAWVYRRAGMDGRGKSRTHRDSIPGPSSSWRFAITTELSRPTMLPVIHTIR